MNNYLFWTLIGYLSGSVLYAFWIPKQICNIDIRTLGEDGNPGTFNVFAHCGLLMGSVVLFLELGKGFLPVYMAGKYVSIHCWPFAFVLAAPVAGHAFPLWSRFRGGKGIAASFGSLLGLEPFWAPVLLLAVCYLLFTLVIVIEPHLMRSIVTFALWEIVCWRTFGNVPLNLGCFLISLLVVGKHLEHYRGERIRLGFLSMKKHRKR